MMTITHHNRNGSSGKNGVQDRRQKTCAMEKIQDVNKKTLVMQKKRHDRIPMEEILVSARLSAIAYLNPNDEPHVFSQLGQHGTLLYFDASHVGNDTQAFLWWNAQEKRVYIFFRGTDSKRDMLSNLDVRTWYMKKHGVCVHRGFQEQFLVVKEDMTRFLEKHKRGIDHVIFCGHSLGGALATIASAHFAHMLGPEIKVSCHTFGAPRVGNRAFSKHMNKLIGREEHWRVYHERDPICFIPMSFRFCHVHHTGLRLKHDSCQMKRTRYDTPWFLRPLDMMFRWQCIHPFGPHSMQTYLAKIQAQIQVYGK